MNHKNVYRILFVTMTLVLLTITSSQVKAGANEIQIPQEVSNCNNSLSNKKTDYILNQETIIEKPKEHTQREYEEEINAFYDEISDFEVLYNLQSPEGIDPKLLPLEITLLVDSDTKIIAYKETSRKVNSIPKVGDRGIPCATYNATRDITVSEVFGEIEQFSRVLALRYDQYPGCDRLCHGWEYEQQWARWTRDYPSWSIGANSAQMKTYSTSPENFCTESQVSLNYASSWFTPTFSGNSTNWWSISGFPNIAYVPFPSAISQTRGDVMESGIVEYNDAITSQLFTNN